MSDERGPGDGAESEETVRTSATQTLTPVVGSSSSSSVHSLPTPGNDDGGGTTKQKVSAPKDTALFTKREQIASKKWEPNSDLMKQLTDMGISRTTAKKALFYTGNNSAELAATWIFENPDADLDTPLEMEGGMKASNDDNDDDGSIGFNDVFKMVFVVNSGLEMGVGKIAAQVAHSAIAIHQLLLQNEVKHGESLLKWFEYGETKIVLKGESTQHLIELEKKSLQYDLPSYLVQDAGKTQVPVGSTTVLCIFGKVDVVDKVTGSLRLL